jgi:predicted porin
LGYNTSEADNATNFLAKIGLNHRLSKKYAALLEYQVAKLQTTSIDSTGTAANEFIDEWQYDYGVKFEADWKKFPWDIRYSHRDVKFDGDYDSSEYSRDIINLSGYIPLKNKKEFLWGYTFGSAEYPNRINDDDDFDFNRFRIGFKSKIFRKIDGTIKFGAGVYEYKDGTETNSFEYSGNLDYKPRKNLLISLQGEKSTEASTISSEKSVDRNEISLNCKYLPKFSKKLTLNAGVNFYSDEYESGAKDDGTSFTIGADYRMNKWLILGLDYTRSKRDSDEPEREFEQNILALKAKGEF